MRGGAKDHDARTVGRCPANKKIVGRCPNPPVEVSKPPDTAKPGASLPSEKDAKKSGCEARVKDNEDSKGEQDKKDKKDKDKKDKDKKNKKEKKAEKDKKGKKDKDKKGKDEKAEKDKKEKKDKDNKIKKDKKAEQDKKDEKDKVKVKDAADAQLAIAADRTAKQVKDAAKVQLAIAAEKKTLAELTPSGKPVPYVNASGGKRRAPATPKASPSTPRLAPLLALPRPVRVLQHKVDAFVLTAHDFQDGYFAKGAAFVADPDVSSAQVVMVHDIGHAQDSAAALLARLFGKRFASRSWLTSGTQRNVSRVRDRIVKSLSCPWTVP